MKQLFLILLCTGSFSLAARIRTITGVVLKADTIKGLADTSIGTQVCLLEDTVTTKKRKPCKKGTATGIDGGFSIEYDSSYGYIEFYDLDYFPRVFKISDLNDSLNIITLYPTGKTTKLNIVTPYKPAIYLYPAQTTTVSVLHDFRGTIGTTYPDYNNGWHVVATPAGTLLNLADNRVYEYLFWDGTCTFGDAHFAYKDGFVVHRKDLTNFFLETLSLIGLNNKEMNDFIVYWLPVLNRNETNFIHFRINDNIDNASVLKVDPEPDSWIRLFMEYKEVGNDFTIPAQRLERLPRKGFTLVEWGGSSIGQLMKVL